VTEEQEVVLRLLVTDSKCKDIKGMGIRIRQNPSDGKWYWTHVYSNGEKGPIGGQGFSSKEAAIDSIRTFKRDLSYIDMPIYICIHADEDYELQERLDNGL